MTPNRSTEPTAEQIAEAKALLESIGITTAPDPEKYHEHPCDQCGKPIEKVEGELVTLQDHGLHLHAECLRELTALELLALAADDNILIDGTKRTSAIALLAELRRHQQRSW